MNIYDVTNDTPLCRIEVSDGIQRVHMPDGAPLPHQTHSVVRQDTDAARAKLFRVTVDLLMVENSGVSILANKVIFNGEEIPGQQAWYMRPSDYEFPTLEINLICRAVDTTK